LNTTWATLRASAQQAAIFSAPRGRAAVQEDHVRVLGHHLVEHRPDALVIVAVHAAGEGDPGALRQEDLGIRAAARIDELAAVDHRRRHRRPVHHRARARPPRLAGMKAVELGGGITDELEAVAALDQGHPLRHEALKLYRPHLRAVLLALAGTLCPLVVIEVEGALELGRFGQRTRIDLIVKGAMGIERELVEKVRGRGQSPGDLGIVGEAV
jgi:hypothetical protein